jgi:hypothetical protein
MGESCRFAHFFFVNMPLKVCLADEMICAEDDTLEVPPGGLGVDPCPIGWNAVITF